MITKQKIGFAMLGVILMFMAAVCALNSSAMALQADPSTGSGTTSGTSPATDIVLDDTTKGDDCGGVKTAIIKCDADNSGDLNKNGIWALLLIFINIMTAGVGVIAVGGIVYGSILYTTAEDKADQVNKAVDIIRNVIIGLVAFALMWALLNFIIPGGVFSA